MFVIATRLSYESFFERNSSLPTFRGLQIKLPKKRTIAFGTGSIACEINIFAVLLYDILTGRCRFITG